MSKLFTTSNYSGNAIGPNVLLKVMGGDNLSATTNYYYESTSSPLTNYDIKSNIISTLLAGFGGSAVSDIAKNQAGAIQSSLVGGLNPFLTTKRPDPAIGVPKAYLNYIFFDESFNPITDASGALLVGTNTQSSITISNLKAPKNGYAYIYLSNESNLPVYFDDFQVSHERSAIIEETHYYPHGLKIATLCSKAFNKLNNKYTYQGDFSEEETETGYDEFDLRLYDPQIGRWIQSDPYDEFASGYIGMGNDPVNFVDPIGGFRIDFGTIGQITGSVLGDRALISVTGAAIGFGIDKLTGGNGWKGAGIGGSLALIGTFIPPINIETISDIFYKVNSLVDKAANFLEKAFSGAEAMNFINVVILHGIDELDYDGAAGGKLGGHVMINFGDDNLYGFTGWGINRKIPYGQDGHFKDVPLLPSKDENGNKWYSQIHGTEYHGGMSLIKSGFRLQSGNRVPLGIATTFKVPVTQEQYNTLKNWYLENLGKSPYPYTQFGMRCASSAYSSLRRVGVIKNNLPLNSSTNSFGPGLLFRYLWNSGYQNKTTINLSGINKNKVNFYGRSSIRRLAGN